MSNIENSEEIDPRFEGIKAPQYFDFTTHTSEGDEWFDHIHNQVEISTPKKMKFGELGFRTENQNKLSLFETGYVSSTTPSKVKFGETPEKRTPLEQKPQQKTVRLVTPKNLFNGIEEVDEEDVQFLPQNITKTPGSKTPSSTTRRWRPPPLTVPNPPNFATETRLRLKRQREEISEPNPNSTNGSIIRQKPETHGLTIPESPLLQTAERVRHYLKRSVDEIEQRMAAEEEQQKMKRRRLVEKWTNSHLPPVEPKPLTVPQEIHFHTENRLRHRSKTPEESVERQAKKPRVEPCSGLTIPAPFDFHTEERAAIRPNKSILEQSFHKSKVNQSTSGSLTSGTSSQPMGLTITEPFPFETEQRILERPKRHVMTFAEREEMELKKIEPFKATPVMWQELQNSFSTSKHSNEPRTLTQPQAPTLLTAERTMFHRKVSEESRPQQFSARPLDHKIFEHDNKEEFKYHFGVELTNPQSPALRTKHRDRVRNILKPKKAPQVAQFKAQPMPSFENVFQPKKNVSMVTDPEPFDLKSDARGSTFQEKFRNYLNQQEKEEQKAKNFVARNLPVFEPPVPPSHNVIVTEPAPFSFLTDTRGSVAEQKLQEKLEEERRREQQEKEFRARPLMESKPFFPQKSRQPLTQIENIQLHSDSRAQKRKVWETQKKSKEQEYLEHLKIREMEQKKREEEEMKVYRQTLIHKPQPITWHLQKPISVAQPSKPLTIPSSPAFKTKERIRMRNI